MAETTLNPHIEKWAHLLPNQHCYLEVSQRGSHMWSNHHGQYHRVDADGNQDGPAYIAEDGTQVWWLNDKRHHLGGPAVIRLSGTQLWCLDGKLLSQEEWAADPRVIAYHSRTQEGAESWLKQL